MELAVLRKELMELIVPGMEDTLYDSESVRQFCLGKAAVTEEPDITMIQALLHGEEVEVLGDRGTARKSIEKSLKSKAFVF